jgi:hypothetical protein
MTEQELVLIAPLSLPAIFIICIIIARLRDKAKER